jgi:hypothetical protein
MPAQVSQSAVRTGPVSVAGGLAGVSGWGWDEVRAGRERRSYVGTDPRPSARVPENEKDERNVRVPLQLFMGFWISRTGRR